MALEPIHLGERYGLRPQTTASPNNGHRNTRLFDEFSLSEAVALHPYAYKRMVHRGLGVDRFMGLSRASAAAMDACWEGCWNSANNNDYSQFCYSRNSITWPAGEYWLNHTYELSSGVHQGQGTNGFYSVYPSSTQLVYWHETWLSPHVATRAGGSASATPLSPALSGDYRNGTTASERFLVRNVNWGSNLNQGYHEGFVFDGFRLTGVKANTIFGGSGTPYTEGYMVQRFDPWTPVHGLGVWRAGEASEIGRVLIEDFNGYGAMYIASTPGTTRLISVFNNRFGGIGLIGTDLATMNFITISGDENPCLIDMRAGGQYGAGEQGGTLNIGLIKSETGTHTESANFYYKGQMIAELRGQFSVNIGAIWYACSFVNTDAAFTVDDRLSGGGGQQAHLKVGTFKGFGFKAYVHDTNNNKAWLAPSNYNSVGLEWNNYVEPGIAGGSFLFSSGLGTAGNNGVGATTNNASSRMDFLAGAATAGTWNYAAGTPLYSYIGPTGSTGSTGASPTPAVSASNVWPDSFNVPFGATTSLQAYIEGTGAYGTAGTWSIISGPGSLSSNTTNPTVFAGPTSGAVTTSTVRFRPDDDITKYDDVVLSIGTSVVSGNTGATGATVGLLANYTFGGTSTMYITGSTGPVMKPKFSWMAADTVASGVLTNSNPRASYALDLPVVRKIILRGLNVTDTNPRYQYLFANISVNENLQCELDGEVLSMSVAQLSPGVSEDVTINIPAGTAITHFLNGPGEKAALKMVLSGLELYDWI